MLRFSECRRNFECASIPARQHQPIDKDRHSMHHAKKKAAAWSPFFNLYIREPYAALLTTALGVLA